MTLPSAPELDQLSAFVADLQPGDVPGEVRDRAALVLADTVAAIVAASPAPELAAFRRRTIARGGPATALAPGLPGAAASDAAFANGLAATWLEVDEVGLWGHAAAHVVPALLAAAEGERHSGSDLLTAFVAGYEVHARLASAAKLRPTLHQSGSVGVVAAAVALAKLEGASAAETSNRAALAAQLMLASSYAGSVAGATVRNAHPALAARAAFLVGDLHRSGFTGFAPALAEVLGETLGSEFEPGGLVGDHGWAVLESAFKLHAGCGHLHPVFAGLADAFRAMPVPGTYPPVRIEPVPEQLVERVDVDVVPGAERLDDPRPPNALAARFSMPFGVACFLTFGTVAAHTFDLPIALSKSVGSLAQRVRLRAEPTLRRARGELPARVAVHLRTGEVLRGECVAPYGWPARPAQSADVGAKFRELCTPVLGSATDDLWEICMSLEGQTAVNLSGVRCGVPG